MLINVVALEMLKAKLPTSMGKTKIFYTVLVTQYFWAHYSMKICLSSRKRQIQFSDVLLSLSNINSRFKMVYLLFITI